MIDDILFKFKTFGSFLLAFITYLIGGVDELFETLIILIILDYFTGICKSIYQKKFSLKVNIKGIVRKIGYIVIIALATAFDRVVITDTDALRTLVIYFFIAYESLSILENWKILKLPLPNKMFEVFRQILNEKIIKSEEKEGK